VWESLLQRSHLCPTPRQFDIALANWPQEFTFYTHSLRSAKGAVQNESKYFQNDTHSNKNMTREENKIQF
jgi:hypothetical protein